MAAVVAWRELRQCVQAPLRANIRLTFQDSVTRFHSPFTFSRPRRENWRKPMTDLMMPNTEFGRLLAQGVGLPALRRCQSVPHRVEWRRVVGGRRGGGKALLPGRMMTLTASRNQRSDP